MRKTIISTLFILFFWNCNQPNKTFRQDFSKKEQQILDNSAQIIKNTYFGSFTSIDKNGYPKIRPIEPLSPDKEFVIYFATKPNTRKVKEIEKNSNTSFHFFDKSQLAYVSLYGNSVVMTNIDSIKKHWNPAWNKYYPDKKYVLIKFVPEFLEMVNIKTGLTGNDKNWMPERVVLRK